MANVGGHWYLFLILLVVVLIIWGPGKLPDVGAGMGRAIREFRKASSETKDAFTSATAGTDTPAATPSPAPEQPPAETPKQETPASS